MAQGYYRICPQRRQHSSVGTMLETYTLMTDDKSLPWNFSSYSHVTWCQMHCLLLQQAERKLWANQLQRVNQIQELHDQNDDEEKKWHTVMKLQEIDRTTTQDLEIWDPSTEPGNWSISCCNREIDTINNRSIKQKCFQTWDWGGKGEMMCR